VPTWSKGIHSARRRLQYKVQVHRWTVRQGQYLASFSDRRGEAAPQQPPGTSPLASGSWPQRSASSPEPSLPADGRLSAAATPTNESAASLPSPSPAPSGAAYSFAVGRGQPGFITSWHVLTFFLVLLGALVVSAVWLHATADVDFSHALFNMLIRLLKSTGFRQFLALIGAIVFVRLALEPTVRVVRSLLGMKGPWSQSSEYYILKEVYRPIEGLLVIAACATLVENFVPSLIAVPKKTVSYVVHAVLSLSFVIATAGVVFNVKARMVKETSWQLELNGKVTQQRRIEAIDKLLTLLTLLVSGILGLQAIGLDVNSLLAIGGIGGLAAGLAGRELLENLFNGLIIMSSSPFEVGEEVIFQTGSGREVEGIVVDVGWYRTSIRSFEREIFVIPNSVFSRTVVLNVTRKNGEWRFYEFLDLRPEDIDKASAIVADMRKVIRSHPSVIQKLHRRVFINKLTKEECGLYLSFYVAAVNRDAFMAVRQDLFMTFVDIIHMHGAQLAKRSMKVYLGESDGGRELLGLNNASGPRHNVAMTERTLHDRSSEEWEDPWFPLEEARPSSSMVEALGRPPRSPSGARRSGLTGQELAEGAVYGALAMGGTSNTRPDRSDDGDTIDMILGEWTDDVSRSKGPIQQQRP